MAAGAGTHYPLPSGPDGAESWCVLDQQYCGGTNPAGDAITCACCAAAAAVPGGEPADAQSDQAPAEQPVPQPDAEQPDAEQPGQDHTDPAWWPQDDSG